MYAPSQNLLLTNTELMIWHLYLDVAIQLNLFLLYLFFIFPPIFFPPGNFILPSQRCMVFFFFLKQYLSLILLSLPLLPHPIYQESSWLCFWNVSWIGHHVFSATDPCLLTYTHSCSTPTLPSSSCTQE